MKSCNKRQIRAPILLDRGIEVKLFSLLKATLLPFFGRTGYKSLGVVTATPRRWSVDQYMEARANRSHRLTLQQPNGNWRFAARSSARPNSPVAGFGNQTSGPRDKTEPPIGQ